MSSATFGQAGYIFGGSGSTGGRVNTVYKYEIDSWTTMLNMTDRRSGATCGKSSDYAYVVGGDGDAASNENFQYSVTGNSWATKTDYPSPDTRIGCNQFSLNEDVYLFGGNNGSARQDDNDLYDTSGDSWTSKASLPSLVFRHAAFTASGKGYSIAGVYTFSVSDNNEYDTDADSWSAKTDGYEAEGPSGISRAKAGNMVSGRDITGTITFLDAHSEYKPATDSWTSKESTLSPFRYLGAGMGPL